MSINFHAYQCRDYLLSDYEEIEKLQSLGILLNYDVYNGFITISKTFNVNYEDYKKWKENKKLKK